MNPAKLARQLNEAAALHQQGILDQAETLYRSILKQVPRQPDALHLLGVLVDQRGDRTKGISLVRQALAVQSAFPDAHFNLGRMLNEAGDVAGAKQHYEQALAIKPGHALAHNGLGTLHRAMRAYPEACAAFERAMRFDPRQMEPYINLCNTYRDICNEAGILKVADQGLVVDPHCAQLHLLRAEASFTVGNLIDGWRGYEWRFKTPQRPVDMQSYALPFWQGEDLAAKGILIWCEQGVGDEIIFAGMVADVAARAGRCVLQTTPRLVPLFARAFPKAEVLSGIVPADIVRHLHVQSSMGSLGQWTRPTFRSFPAATGYLKADPAKTAALRAKYAAGRDRALLVGLAWRSTNVNDAAEKTIDLTQWGAVLNVPGVTFVNLQYGDTRAAVAAARTDFGVDIINDPEIDALADLDGFAAQVAAMDLVISSSNTAAHMAGALDVPTFCIVPRALGSGRRWYWFGHGQYAPWYRSMTLFRQTQSAGWLDVMADIGLALVEAAASAGVMVKPEDFLERLARGFVSAGMIPKAEAAYDRAVAFAPTSAALLRESAKLKLKRGAAQDALALLNQAVRLDPRSADLHNMHGMALARTGRFDAAAAAYRRAIILAPAQAELYNNLGTSLRRSGRSMAACESYAEAHRLKPEHPGIFLNFATALSESGRLGESLAALDNLIARHPDHVDAQYNRALVLMALGHFDLGWQAFKWRLKRGEIHVRHEDFPQPVWAGQDLADKHVLVWTDLGIGDEILVGSILPDLVAAARRVTLLCSARLVALFRRSFPGITVDIRTTPLPPAATSKDIDLQMSLAEMGAAFRRSFESFPARSNFLATEAGLRAALREKYLAGRKDRLVGISWRSVNPEIGAQKSIPLAEWLPILKVPGITFVNLQYGDCRAEIEALRHDHGVEIISDASINPLGDIAPVAAQTAAMDLVITVSNTTVHLSGATGVPAWVLLPKGHARLWYWFRGLDRCAWYPSVKLLTSDQEADWDQLIVRCATDLTRWTEAAP